MEEKVYKTMKGAGALNIVFGIVSIVIGIATGVFLIISGAKLLSNKSKILFQLHNNIYNQAFPKGSAFQSL